MNETENNDKVLGNSGLSFNAGDIFENDRRFKRTQAFQWLKEPLSEVLSEMGYESAELVTKGELPAAYFIPGE